MTCSNIRRLGFDVDISEVWLRDELDGRAYFPEPNGSFRGLLDLQVLTVEGPAADEVSPMPRVSNMFSSTSASRRGLPPPPFFRSVVTPRNKTAPATFKMKVIKAKMFWKGTYF